MVEFISTIASFVFLTGCFFIWFYWKKRPDIKKLIVSVLASVFSLILVNLTSNQENNAVITNVSQSSELSSSSSKASSATSSTSTEPSTSSSDESQSPIRTIDSRTELQSLFILLSEEWSDYPYSEIDSLIKKTDLYSYFNQKIMDIATKKPADFSIWGTKEDYIEIYFYGKLAGHTYDTDKMSSVTYYMHDIPLKIKVEFSKGITLTDYNIPSNVGSGFSTDYEFSTLDEAWEYISTTYPDAKFD